MDRKSQENFIEKAWKNFKTEQDTVEMPVLSSLSQKAIDGMVAYFEYCYQEEQA